MQPDAADADQELANPLAPRAAEALQAMADATVAGFGISWLPCWLVRESLLKGELVRLMSERPGMSFEAHAVWPQTPHLSLKVRLAVDTLVSKLPPSLALVEKAL